MKKGKSLITLMLATSFGLGFTAMAAGCSGKSEDELRCENEIRKMLEYDANIDISKATVENYGFSIEYNIPNNNEYIIKIKTKRNYAYHPDIITYSVDKDFFYNFKNEYSTTESQKEVDLIKALTTIYDPVAVIEDGEEKDIINNI